MSHALRVAFKSWLLHESRCTEGTSVLPHLWYVTGAYGRQPFTRLSGANIHQNRSQWAGQYVALWAPSRSFAVQWCSKRCTNMYLVCI